VRRRTPPSYQEAAEVVDIVHVAVKNVGAGAGVVVAEWGMEEAAH